MRGARELYDLQLIDLAIGEKRGRLEEIEATLGESQELQEARDTLEREEKRLKELRRGLRDLDLELGSLVAKLSAAQELLYSGQIKSPKGLSDKQQETDYLARRKEKLEDEIIGMMTQLEETQAKVSVQREVLRELETEWEESQDVLRKEREELSRQLVELASSRQQTRDLLDGGELALYGELRRKKAGRPVALLRDGTCQACGVTLPISTIRMATREQGLAFCDSCGRILYAEGR